MLLCLCALVPLICASHFLQFLLPTVKYDLKMLNANFLQELTYEVCIADSF